MFNGWIIGMFSVLQMRYNINGIIDDGKEVSM